MTTTKIQKQKIQKPKDAITPNAFAGRPSPPTDAALAEVLGTSHSLWKTLVADLTSELHLDAAEWHSSSVKLGWSLRLQLKKRNIVYLGPREGWFLAAFALGDKAVAVARKSDLPDRILKLIADARRYAEGTAVRIEVRNSDDARIVKLLARIKTES